MITFFGFPLRDDAKCKLWCERAGFDLSPQRNHFLCETHFSPIYMSKTPRRTILLPTAMPYHHSEQVESTTDTVKMSSADNSADEQYEVVEKYSHDVPIYLEDIDDSDPEKLSLNEDVGHIDYAETEPEQKPIVKLPAGVKIVPVNMFRRKNLRVMRSPTRPVIQEEQSLTKPSDPLGESKKRKLATEKVSNTSINVENTAKEQSVDEEYLIDNIKATPEISTFIFRDEECLQMPKRKYLEQRAELINEINKYKGIVDKMHQVLNGEL